MKKYIIPIEIAGKVHKIEVMASSEAEAKKLAKEKIHEFLKKQYSSKWFR